MLQDTVFSVLWGLMRDPGQLRYFVGLWIVVSVFASLYNNLTVKRMRIAAFYSVIGLTALGLSYHYRYATILKLDIVPVDPIAMYVMVIFSINLGLWTALLMMVLSAKPRGWFYRHLARKLNYVADQIESRIDVSSTLRSASSKLEDKAVRDHPINKILRNLDTSE